MLVARSDVNGLAAGKLRPSYGLFTGCELACAAAGGACDRETLEKS